MECGVQGGRGERDAKKTREKDRKPESGTPEPEEMRGRGKTERRKTEQREGLGGLGGGD